MFIGGVQMMTFIRKSFYLSLFLISTTVFSQGFNESLYNAMKYRNIGPYRGGRSAAVDGVADNKLLAYFGATGGGVWRTNNGGTSWENISDGYFGGSIGAVAVSELSLIHISEPTRPY